MAQNLFRFTLSGPLGTKVISEPEGWNKIKVTLERDKEYHSLVELIETPFIFYGSNGVHDGGKDYIRQTNDTYGVDAQITITIEISNNEGITWEDLFLGLIDMQSIKDIDSRKIQVVITRDDLWAKFKSRVDTPVIINEASTLDNGTAETGNGKTISLPSQKLRQVFIGYSEATEALSPPGNGDYIQFDVDKEVISEIKTKTSTITANNEERPVEIYEMEYAGSYVFEINIHIFFANAYSNVMSDWLQAYVQVNDETPIAMSISEIDNDITFTYNDTLNLEVGDHFRYYVQAITPPPHIGVILVRGNNTFDGDPANHLVFNVTADTVYPETEAESFLVHDVGYKIINRITDLPSFYSDHLGGLNTLGSYSENGCAWPYTLVRGLQLRLYELTEKAFSISFNQWWEGINPIANLGLGYDFIGDDQIIRVEEKAFFYDDNPILELDWVNNIEESYDKENIFNKIRIGFKKWESDDISGIDDPQTKRTYATLFKYAGKEVIIESDFVAASLAIETTRRTTKIKSADYKFDNDTFIISIDPSISGNLQPLTTDYFDSVTNLLNAEFRYNISLTPARNLLRWLNLLSGCLQKDLTSSIKFTGGEGNYDMESNWNSFVYGNCFNITDANFSEKQDIDLATYYPLTGHLFQPIVFEFKHPLSFENYKLIRNNRTRAIAVSGTDSDHNICFIKKLEYDLINSLGTFTVWKK